MDNTTSNNLPVVGKEYSTVPSTVLTPSGQAKMPEITATETIFTEIATTEGQLTKGHITIHQVDKATMIEFAVPTIFRKLD